MPRHALVPQVAISRQPVVHVRRVGRHLPVMSPVVGGWLRGGCPVPARFGLPFGGIFDTFGPIGLTGAGGVLTFASEARRGGDFNG